MMPHLPRRLDRTRRKDRGARRTPRRAAAAAAALVGLFLVTVLAAAPGAQRPPVSGPNAAVSTGHPLTTAAAFEILVRGGNAFDAGVTALLVGGVVEQDLYGLGGESLVLVYPVAEGEVVSVVGQGWAPKGASIEWYRSRDRDLFGEGLDPAVVPGALHGALTVLERWGTMSFEEVSARAIEYAEHGFPLRPLTARAVEANLEFMEAWPDNQRFWLKPDGSLYAAGETIRFPTLAATLTKMVEAERQRSHLGRDHGIAAARDRFYKGDIAEEMVAFLQEHGAPFELGDFAEFYSRVEPPTTTDYRGYTIYKHGFNSQGPVLLQTLNILEEFDLRAMGHNSPDYIHTVVEAMKLAYADRDTYYADPDFVDVPAEGAALDHLRPGAGGRDRPPGGPRSRSGPATALPHDPDVDEWPFWTADIADGGGGERRRRLVRAVGRRG